MDAPCEAAQTGHLLNCSYITDNKCQTCSCGFWPVLEPVKKADLIACPKCGNKGKDNETEFNLVVCDWCYFYAPGEVWRQLDNYVALRPDECEQLVKLLGHMILSPKARKVVDKLKEATS